MDTDNLCNKSVNQGYHLKGAKYRYLATYAGPHSVAPEATESGGAQNAGTKHRPIFFRCAPPLFCGALPDYLNINEIFSKKII